MMQLAITQCGKTASTDTPVRNSFIVRAFNTLTHESEANWTINFDKEAFPAGAAGQKTLPSSALTNPKGIAFGPVWTGDKVGGYTYRVVCPSCLANPQVWCSVLAALPPKVEAVPLDEGPEAGDPTVTPMLRISNVYYPNDHVSFTTHDGEKTVTLEAELRPTDTALAGNITWEVKDSPRDAPDMDSGDPDDPAPGESTVFDVTAPPAFDLPNENGPKGRPLPLKYQIQASVMTPKGLVKSYPRHIKQDVIDKCRQEYLDFGTTEFPARSAFSPMDVIHETYDSDLVKFKDCYAYINPSRAQEAKNLKTIFPGVSITSGYRSPRKNWDSYGEAYDKYLNEGTVMPPSIRSSRHMFGEAVDLGYPPHSAAIKWENLWQAADKPKILEAKSVDLMMGVEADGTPWIAPKYRAYTPEARYALGHCLHLGE